MSANAHQKHANRFLQLTFRHRTLTDLKVASYLKNVPTDFYTSFSDIVLCHTLIHLKVAGFGYKKPAIFSRVFDYFLFVDFFVVFGICVPDPVAIPIPRLIPVELLTFILGINFIGSISSLSFAG